ncbi:Uncharacterised protein [Klebsiella pneumoniae]|uniref:hypothetical protein n=1 Tax=Klebsiella pneumoniae TaxID=573 RepID=UPI0007CD0D32|nr:hypothetical protein [Klebsiella pneumoniae]SAW13553.1 Uncharacterised protein [Klebsiella pneumoniae]
MMLALEELQERRKVERDTEPYGFTDGDRRGMIYKPEHSDRLSEPVPVYRHAQPVPVVMDDTKLRELFDSWFASDCSFDLPPEASEADNIAWRESYWYVWQRCRAAMLQELKKSAGTEAICRSDENVQVLHTKSPAQSDCCPAQNSVTPAQNSVTPAQNQGWIPVSEQKPDCWCLTCRPVTLNDMRFVVCPDCGNKRCPRANDHRDACTGSNEPGQEGSVYPAAQQEVKGE